MTIQELETALYHQMFDFFKDHGYEMMPGLKQFRKVTPNGFRNVIFSTADYDTEIWLDLNIGIRQGRVEQLAQQFLDNFQPYQKESNTLVVSVGKFNNDKYFRYKIAYPEDLSLSCEQIKQFLIHQGFPFLEKSASLPELDRLLNKHPRKSCPYLYNQVHRCFKGLIVGRLVRNPKFAYLLETYRHYLSVSGSSEKVRQSFEKLVTYLAHYSFN